MLEALRNPKQTVKIAMVGKYVELHDSYISVNEALKHGGIETRSAIDIDWIDSETLEGDADLDEILGDVDGILVPGGFGSRGIEGKINACQYAELTASLISAFALVCRLQLLNLQGTCLV